ncbi:MAG TPA: phosphate regulon sensor histidine kinase PhoR [Burkholderiales bacterium]|nr:phosphate regulon sensor histidine kinase PhoR [Burkholderiales bacterium]
MRRQLSGRTGPGKAAHGFALPFALLNSRPVRVALSVAGFGLFALAVNLLARTEIRWELWAAGLLGLLAYNVGYPVPSWTPKRGAAGADARAGPGAGPDAVVSPGDRRRRGIILLSGPRALPEEGPPVSYGLTILDREFRIVWCNDAAAVQFGIDTRWDIGRRIAAAFRHPSLAAYLAAGDFSKSLRIPAAQGDVPVLSVQFVPYVASGWLLLSRNVARAARLEIMRRECIANVSHELRAPLTVLVGFLETVRDLEPGPQASRDYLDRMEEQCRRMQRIIEDLLRLSTLEAASEPPDERVSVAGVLARIQAEAEALSAGRHRIVVEANSGFDLLGAEIEVASAFGNLASNAVRYTLPGGLVRITWCASPAGAEFVVEDTGIGIEKQHIPRLTERFYRVDRERSRHTAGSGLGLAIVGQVLSRHQATLEIESEPGKGSRFTARFPAHRIIAAAARS